MKNPNSLRNRIVRWLSTRWSSEDYPGATPHFQVTMLAKDIAVFVMLPLFAILMFRACTGRVLASAKKSQAKVVKQDRAQDGAKSQIIEFDKAGSAGHLGRGGAYSSVAKRTQGTLVRVRLLNVVETYSTAPVHAQIIDEGLGSALYGGTIIGDANPDPAYERITIGFRVVRDPNRENMAVPIAARALSLDGTLGLEATKKEGFVARAAYGSAVSGTQEIQSKLGGAVDLKDILLRVLTAGAFQEFGSGAQVEKNRAQVLALSPSTEFFAELTDSFPGGAK